MYVTRNDSTSFCKTHFEQAMAPRCTNKQHNQHFAICHGPHFRIPKKLLCVPPSKTNFNTGVSFNIVLLDTKCDVNSCLTSPKQLKRFCRTEMLLALSRRLRVLYMMTGQPLMTMLKHRHLYRSKHMVFIHDMIVCAINSLLTPS